MGRLVKFVSRLGFVGKAVVAKVVKADELERRRLEGIGKQVALDAMAYELGRATEVGLYWKTKASENNLMATMILSVKKSGYVVVPKNRIDGANFSYSIDVKEREDDVRFKLIETKRKKNVEAVQDNVIPIQRDKDAPSDSGVPQVQTPTNGSNVVSGLARGDVSTVPNAVGSDDARGSDEEGSK